MADASSIQYQPNFQGSGMDCHSSGTGHSREIKCRAASFEQKFPSQTSQGSSTQPSPSQETYSRKDITLSSTIGPVAGIATGLTLFPILSKLFVKIL